MTENRAVCVASPSLALIKYWGKESGGANIPATGSLAVTLDGLQTRTEVEVTEGGEDLVEIDGRPEPLARFVPFFDNFRDFLCRSLDSSQMLYQSGDPSTLRFHARTSNSFPTAAGIASSSSGFAALAGACSAAVGVRPPLEELSALARVGSGSAARSVYGGFVLLPAGALHARPVHPAGWMPDLRVVVAVVRAAAKDHASRDAMEQTKTTSPYYPAWVESSRGELEAALAALDARDLEALGESMRRSYLRMFATMFSADPPILYWLPESLALIRMCGELRRNGIPAWETMDAGPQVKIITLEEHVQQVLTGITERVPGAQTIVAAPGRGLRFPEQEESDEAYGTR